MYESRLVSVASVMLVWLGLWHGAWARSGPRGMRLVGVVNLNQATEAQLRLLPGIGSAKARAIIRYRARRPFSWTGQVRRVKGIGRKMFRRMRPYLRVRGETTLMLVRPEDAEAAGVGHCPCQAGGEAADGPGAEARPGGSPEDTAGDRGGSPAGSVDQRATASLPGGPGREPLGVAAGPGDHAGERASAKGDGPQEGSMGDLALPVTLAVAGVPDVAAKRTRENAPPEDQGALAESGCDPPLDDEPMEPGIPVLRLPFPLR